MEGVQLLGIAGMLLVFASFIVKRWIWLYSFNMTGALLLAVYAYLRGDYVFLVVETGIVVFLAYRLLGEVSKKREDNA
ncbi:MAG: lipid-A-disaccharide synthase N-terminal domain-containing protein [Desulfurococcales archaeon]|nr:lipid-A-disaccharide synthase N-terminal domain-containing protein [Desulfurococcales archaeon]